MYFQTANGQEWKQEEKKQLSLKIDSLYNYFLSFILSLHEYPNLT